MPPSFRTLTFIRPFRPFRVIVVPTGPPRRTRGAWGWFPRHPRSLLPHPRVRSDLTTAPARPRPAIEQSAEGAATPVRQRRPRWRRV